jgi:hypothetical protein
MSMLLINNVTRGNAVNGFIDQMDNQDLVYQMEL